VADSKRERAVGRLSPGEVIGQTRILREKGMAAMEALAANEEEIARLHDELANTRPDRRDEYQRTADQARIAACKAREIVRKFTG